MDLSKDDVVEEVVKLGMSKELAHELWDKLEKKNVEKPSPTTFSTIVYYLGTFIILIALSWFLQKGWDLFGGGAIFLIACVYAALFIGAGNYLWKKDLKTPGGLFFTLAVCMAPLAIFGLEHYFGLWYEIDPVHMPKKLGIFVGQFSENANRLLMETSAVIASLVALRFVPFTFLTVPLFISLWLMSIDIAQLLHLNEVIDELAITKYFGLALLLVAYILDGRTKKDYSFWGYIIGTIAFWIGITFVDRRGELSWFAFLLMNFGLIILSIILERRVLLIFGSLGVINYFARLAYDIFRDTLWFPFALSLFGILVIWLGIVYQKNEARLHAFFQKLIPPNIQKIILPKYRKSSQD